MAFLFFNALLFSEYLGDITPVTRLDTYQLVL